MRKLRHVLRIGRAVRLVWASGRGWTVANGGLVIVQGLLPVLAIYLMKLIVDSVADGVTAPDKAEAFGRVAVYLVAAAAVALVGGAAQAWGGLVTEAQAQAVTDHVHNVLHAKSIEVDLQYYESPEYYDTLHRAQREAPYRAVQIVNGLMQVGQKGISLVAVAGLLFTLHWGLAAVLLAAALPAALVQVKYARRTFDWQRQATAEQRRAWYLNWVLTGDEHAKEVRLFGLGPLFIRMFRDLRQRLREQRLAIAGRRAVAEMVTLVSSALAVFGSFAFIAYRTVQGALTLGGLVMYYQAFHRGQAFLMDMLRGLAGLYENSLFLSSFYDFLELERSVAEPAHPKPFPEPMRTGIVLERVSFRYPGSEREALKDVCLTIGQDEVIALVGENGAGKTTLVKLLCRLYEPTGGRILVDGVDIRDFETAALRRQVSVILQDYARYHLTARENIWLGNTTLPPDDERIITAAQQSGADEAIARLTHGYDSMLGKHFVGGEELSIGEWQKVALARAFVRDAQLIVLDEPTSSLDARTEYEVFGKFRKLVDGRAAVLISHRFSTVRMADRIYVLKDGKVAECGTHDELAQGTGEYARLFETQAQYYR